MRVNEIFFRQKEPATTFLMLQGCSLRCKWAAGDCDLPQVLDMNEGTEIPTDQVAQTIAQYRCKRLVIVGGDPLMQLDQVVDLVNRFEDYAVEIQTNGVLPISQKLIDILPKIKLSITPKLSNAGNKGEYVRSEYLDKASSFKFLVEIPGELGEIDRFVEFHNIEPTKVFLRARCPSLDDHNSKIPWIKHHANIKGYAVIPRHHHIESLP